MPKSTLSLYIIHSQIEVKKRFTDSAGDIDGKTILEWFRDFLANTKNQHFTIPQKDIYVTESSHQSIGHAELVKVGSGIYGQKAPIRNIANNKLVNTRQSDEAVTPDARLMFCWPEGAPFAIAGVEFADNSDPSLFLKSFLDYMEHNHKTYCFRLESVLEKGSWPKDAKLIGITKHIRAYKGRLSYDQGTKRGDDVLDGSLDVVFKPKRGESFPKQVWNFIYAHPKSINDASLVVAGDSTDARKSPVWKVTVRSEKRTKIFELGGDGRPPIRQVLTEAGKPLYNDKDFQDEVFTSVNDVYAQFQYDVDPKWVRA